MKESLLIGTGNPGKFKEIELILTDLPLKIVSAVNFAADDLKEDGESYALNAKIKADYYQKKSGYDWVLAEDSGITVDALRGELGINTRRWGKGEKSTDEEWINYFLKRMKGKQNRNASFVCYAVLLLKDHAHIFSGEVKGTITEELKAPIIPGLPLSSCFMPEGSPMVYAELSPEEKAKMSHRALAITKAKNFLLNYLQN